MKKILGWIWTAGLLLGLCGCAQPAEEPPVVETPATEIVEENKGIVTDAGQAETLVEPFARTAIIARNEWVEGTYVQSKQWALEYARQKYPDCTNLWAEYDSGYVLPGAMTPEEGLSGGVAVWEVTVKRGEDSEKERVQLFYFTERDSDGFRTYLSGLLTGEEIRSTRPAGYAYLILDTRFAGRTQTLPNMETPEGALALEFTLEQEAVDQQFYPLSDNVIAVLCRYSRRYQSDDKLLVYHLETGEVLLEEWLSGFWGWTGGGDGWAELEYFYADDEMRLSARVILTEEGATLERYSQPYSQYQVGQYVLTWKDERVMLGEEVLLGRQISEEEPLIPPEDGDHPEETQEEMPEQWVMYNFHQALDEYRFLFSQATVERIEYYGIYDLESRTIQVLAGTLQPWDFHVLQISADSSRALMGYGGYSRWGMTLVDLQTLEQRIIPLEYNSEERSVEQVVVNDDLSRMAVMDLNAEDSGRDRIQVFDTATGKLLYQWDVPMKLVSGEPEIRLVGEQTLLVNVRQWKTDTEWVYRVQF